MMIYITRCVEISRTTHNEKKQQLSVLNVEKTYTNNFDY